MEILLLVITVIAALSCLVMLLVSDARDYMNQATVKQQSSKLNKAGVQ
jgi:hypothetical protein